MGIDVNPEGCIRWNPLGTLSQITQRLSMSVIGIWTKPLARRTLPRARGSAVVEGLKKEVSWVAEKRRSL